MRLQVHDFSGHPFQAELSRELAARGHSVDHVYSAQYSSGKGVLERKEGDPALLGFSPLDSGTPFQKYSALGRLKFEQAYARTWLEHNRRTEPECIVACNVPLFALDSFRRAAGRSKQPWLLWHQDLFSNAISEELSRRLPGPAARSGSALVRRIEAGIVRSASQVVAIGEEFRLAYRQWGLDTGHVSVIPNWAPLEEIVPRPRRNAWAAANLPATPELRLLYAGTLGRKHNPLLLSDLLRSALDAGLPVRLIVASEGEGIEMLRADLDPDLPVTLLPFQPAADLPDMLGSADVLVTILEPEASRFSIPSKVLSSLAAGRPLLGLMPEDNPAAADILAAEGYVGPPTEFGVAGAIVWLRSLNRDPAAADRLGAKGRALAESRFGIVPIADRFEAVLRRAMPGADPAPHDPRPRPAHAGPSRFRRKQQNAAA